MKTEEHSSYMYDIADGVTKVNKAKLLAFAEYVSLDRDYIYNFSYLQKMIPEFTKAIEAITTKRKLIEAVTTEIDKEGLLKRYSFVFDYSITYNIDGSFSYPDSENKNNLLDKSKIAVEVSANKEILFCLSVNLTDDLDKNKECVMKSIKDQLALLVL
jgi:hypothetical protein